MVTAGRRARLTASAAVGDHDGGEVMARARERLRQAMAGGDYDGLLDPALWRLLDAAAMVSGFGREIGALRFAMARLLAEEEDPRQLATQLARVTSTIVRATQAQWPSARADDPVRAALLAGLGELEGGDGDDGASELDGEEDE